MKLFMPQQPSPRTDAADHADDNFELSLCSDDSDYYTDLEPDLEVNGETDKGHECESLRAEIPAGDPTKEEDKMAEYEQY